MKKTTIFVVEVFVIFITLIFTLHIGEEYQFHLWFGDVLCEGFVSNNYGRCSEGFGYYHGPTWHWGYLHFLYCIMNLVIGSELLYKVYKNQPTK